MNFNPKFLDFLLFFQNDAIKAKQEKYFLLLYRPTPNMCHNFNKEIFVLKSRKNL